MLDELPGTTTARLAAYRAVADRAEWSPWEPLHEAAAARLPGVFLLRESRDGVIRFVGRASERAGSGRAQGLHGRLRSLRDGHEAVTSFGEAALDRALADPAFVAARLDQLRHDGAQRSREWVRDAVRRLDLEACWTICPDGADARMLETELVLLLRPYGLWVR